MIGVDTTFLVQLALLELPKHRAACDVFQERILDPAVPIALAPQALSEFVHVVTDPKRFQSPLPMAEALRKAQHWWNATEVRRVYPTGASTFLYFRWMEEHRLGRKRILDTQLAATLWTEGVRQICTSNSTDFQLFGFEVIVP